MKFPGRSTEEILSLATDILESTGVESPSKNTILDTGENFAYMARIMIRENGDQYINGYTLGYAAANAERIAEELADKGYVSLS